MISNRCWTMWADSSICPNASTGDARASKSVSRPPAKAASFPIVYSRGSSL